MSNSVDKNVKTTEGLFTRTYLWSQGRFPLSSSVFPESAFKKGLRVPSFQALVKTSFHVQQLIQYQKPPKTSETQSALHSVEQGSLCGVSAHRSQHSNFQQCSDANSTFAVHPFTVPTSHENDQRPLWNVTPTLCSSMIAFQSLVLMWPLTLLRHHGYSSRAATADYDNSKLTKTKHMRHTTTRQTSTVTTTLWIRCVWSRNCSEIINIPICITQFL